MSDGDKSIVGCVSISGIIAYFIMFFTIGIASIILGIIGLNGNDTPPIETSFYMVAILNSVVPIFGLGVIILGWIASATLFNSTVGIVLFVIQCILFTCVLVYFSIVTCCGLFICGLKRDWF